MTITFTNAVVEDDGYGVEVNGRSLEAIISTALGTRLGDKGGYSSGLQNTGRIFTGRGSRDLRL